VGGGAVELAKDLGGVALPSRAGGHRARLAEVRTFSLRRERGERSARSRDFFMSVARHERGRVGESGGQHLFRLRCGEAHRDGGLTTHRFELRTLLRELSAHRDESLPREESDEAEQVAERKQREHHPHRTQADAPTHEIRRQDIVRQ